MKFAGWFLDRGFTGTKYAAGGNIEVGSDGLDVYARYSDHTVKYAVTLYGIGQDVDENGDTLGLTFGPATGADYTHSFQACSGTSAESPGNCLHWMTWQEIINQSQTDPHYFDDCLTNGCTHDVKLNITGKLATGAKDYSGQFDDGDGVGCLTGSINSSYRKWNSKSKNAGGWPASRVRATLNGLDDSIDPSVAGDDCLEDSNCLLDMFPTELRNGIVAKAVKSDTVYNDVSGNNKPTYDKLWLFSGKEIYGDSGRNNDVIRENEGKLYQRAEKLGITTSANRDKLIAYSEDLGADGWWLRSSDRGYGGSVCYVYYDGGWSSSFANNDGGCLAPGFCLPGSKEEIKTTTLKDGEILNVDFKSLAQGTEANVWDSDTLITGIRRSLTPAPNNVEVREIQESGEPVYAWFDSDDKYIHYYTNATDIYMPSESSYLFAGLSSLEDIRVLSEWNAISACMMVGMFEGCESLNDLSPLQKWKTDNVGNMSYMFHDCSSLTDLSPLSAWNSPFDISCMFEACSSLTNLKGLEEWDVANVQLMTAMFRACDNLMDLSAISDWNTGNTEDMSSMFEDCTALNDLTPLSKWNVGKAIKLNMMFAGCSSLTGLYGLEKWDIQNANIFAMFSRCDLLYDISSISQWNVSSITDMMYLFQYCPSLLDASALENWNVNGETKGMFDATCKIRPSWYTGG